MDRAQEVQYIAERTCSWRRVMTSWAALGVVGVGILVAAWSPLDVCKAQASEATKVAWQSPDEVQRLQHGDDDPDEFLDPSAL